MLPVRLENCFHLTRVFLQGISMLRFDPIWQPLSANTEVDPLFTRSTVRPRLGRNPGAGVLGSGRFILYNGPTLVTLRVGVVAPDFKKRWVRGVIPTFRVGLTPPFGLASGVPPPTPPEGGNPCKCSSRAYDPDLTLQIHGSHIFIVNIIKLG